MNQTKASYCTGEYVVQAGDYICEAGRRRAFKEGDKLPYCPVTGLDTNWYLAN